MKSDFTTLQNMCRVCLSTHCNELESLFFPEKNDKISKLKMLISCTSSQITLDDPYPKYICKMCIAKLTIAYKFFSMYRNSIKEINKKKALSDNERNADRVQKNTHEKYTGRKIMCDKINIEPNTTQSQNNIDLSEIDLKRYCRICEKSFTTRAEFSKHQGTHMFFCTDIKLNPDDVQSSIDKENKKITNNFDECKFSTLSKSSMKESHTDLNITDVKDFISENKVREPINKKIKLHDNDNDIDVNALGKKIKHTDTKNKLCKRTQVFKIPTTNLIDNKTIHNISTDTIKISSSDHKKQEIIQAQKSVQCANVLRKKIICKPPKFIVKSKPNACLNNTTLKDKYSKKSLQDDVKLSTKESNTSTSRECFTCKKSFNTIAELLLHNQKMHKFMKCSTRELTTLETIEEESLPANVSDKNVSDDQENSLEPNPKKNNFLCPHCNLYSHQEEISSKPDSCQNIYKNKIKCEKVSNNEKREYICEFCGKTFTTWHRMNGHARKNHRKTHVCEICSKGFSDSYKLKIHKRVHTGERPYLCHKCTESFATNRELNKHKTIHSNKMNFQCTICMKKFSRKNNLQVHLMTHSGVRNFVCKICNKAFTQKHSLKYHMSVHES